MSPARFRDNLLLGDVAATDEQILLVLEYLRLGELIEECQQGLDTVITESTISAGQRQRLAIARGILRPCRILILDEPTAHLDAEAEKAVVDCLDLAARSRAVLTVSHRETTVAGADVVFMVKSGKLMVCCTKGGMERSPETRSLAFRTGAACPPNRELTTDVNGVLY